MALEVVYTWIALRMLEVKHRSTQPEWRLIALKGKIFIEKKNYDYENLTFSELTDDVF